MTFVWNLLQAADPSTTWYRGFRWRPCRSLHLWAEYSRAFWRSLHDFFASSDTNCLHHRPLEPGIGGVPLHAIETRSADRMRRTEPAGQLSLPAIQPRRRIVEDCFRQEAGASTAFPNETADLIEAGILDSMAWVSFLRAVETANGVSGLGSGLNEQPASISSVLMALRSSKHRHLTDDNPQEGMIARLAESVVSLTGSSSALGSQVVDSEDVDRAVMMPIG